MRQQSADTNPNEQLSCLLGAIFECGLTVLSTCRVGRFRRTQEGTGATKIWTDPRLVCVQGDKFRFSLSLPERLQRTLRWMEHVVVAGASIMSSFVWCYSLASTSTSTPIRLSKRIVPALRRHVHPKLRWPIVRMEGASKHVRHL